MIRIAIFFLLTIAAGAAAQGTEIVHWSQQIFQEGDIDQNPASFVVTDVNVTRPHNSTVESSTFKLAVYYSAFVREGVVSGGTRTFTYDIGGIHQNDCEHFVSHSSSSTSYSTGGFRCQLSSDPVGVNDWRLNTTGNGSYRHWHRVIFLEVEDEIMTIIVEDSNEILNTVSTLSTLMLFLALVWWAERSKTFAVYVLAVVAGIFAVTTMWGEFSETVRLFLVGIVLVVIARGYYELQYKDLPLEENDEN